jgi:hypothetical protein
MSFLQQQITLQNIFGAKRMIENITVDAIINEDTNDTLTVTKQPVQTGASITDHAYNEPTVFSMQILQQVNNPITQLTSTFAKAPTSGLAQLYQQFLDLQKQRIPFNILTPKRIYKNMLMTVVRLSTNKATENILSLNLSFQEILFAAIGTTVVAPINQKAPEKTQKTQNTGKKSVDRKLELQADPNSKGFVKPQ